MANNDRWLEKSVRVYDTPVVGFVKLGTDTVILTGTAPVWLYLVIAPVLHPYCTRWIYDSPKTGDVTIGGYQ